MASILCIETATNLCSVALGVNKELLTYKESFDKNTHSESLTIFINDVLSDAGVTFSDLDAIAVGAGPGSYTGLRIGVSTAKGLCYALEKPLISLSSLRTLATGIMVNYIPLKDNKKDVLFCPMIDARRMEVYSAIYNAAGELQRDVLAEIVTETSFQQLLTEFMIVFGGDGSLKCKDLFRSVNAGFSDVLHPSAAMMIPWAFMRFDNNEFEDVAYFEPYYLKDFIAGKPNVKGLV